MRPLLIVVLLAGTAAADSYSEQEYEHNDWHDEHPELSATFAHRDGQLGGLEIHGTQAELGLAWRGKRHATELAYGFGILPAGVAHTFGLRHRYGLAVIGGYEGSLRRGEGWIEAGVGGEVFDWSDAGHLARTTVSLGFGADIDFGNSTYDGEALHWLGARLAVRMTAARAPEQAALAAVCTGACVPRTPHGVDLGIVVSLSMLVGR